MMLEQIFPYKLYKAQLDKKHLEQVVENVKENLKHNIYKTIIPRNVRLAEAPSHGLPINLYDSKSAGADGYRQLASEVIENDEAEHFKKNEVSEIKYRKRK